MRSPFGVWNISFMASAYLYLRKQKGIYGKQAKKMKEAFWLSQAILLASFSLLSTI